MNWPRSGLKWLEAGLMIFGIGLLVMQAFFAFTGSKEMSLAGWAFVSTGAAFAVPRLLATYLWDMLQATVTAIETGHETPTLTYVYVFAGAKISGKISETSGLGIGDRLNVTVNPSCPEENFAMTWAPQVLGWGAVLTGDLILMSGASL